MVKRRGQVKPRQRRHASRGTGQAIVMFAVAAALIGGFAWLYYKASSKPTLDAVTLCPETGSVGDLAILVDLTDPVSMTQLQAARNTIEKLIAEAPVGTRVSFATISPDAQTRQASFRSVCKPPSGADADMLIENPALIRAAYETGFAEPVGATLSRLLTSTEAETSPIMEGLQEFITLIPGYALSDKPRALIILSDLMQNSETISFYQGQDWNAFISGSGMERLSRNLQGVSVSLLRLPAPASKAAIMEDFWPRYFEAQGVERISVITIGDL